MGRCEHVSAERTVVKHYTKEGREESVALKTNYSVCKVPHCDDIYKSLHTFGHDTTSCQIRLHPVS